MIIYFPTYQIVAQYTELNKQLKILIAKRNMFDKSKDRTIFSGCHSANGLTFSVSQKKKILSYLNVPTAKKWDELYKEKVTYSKSLWDAWNKSQKNPILSVKTTLTDLNEKWSRIPTPDDLVIGLQKIIQSEESKLNKSIDCLTFEISNLEYKYRSTLEKQA